MQAQGDFVIAIYNPKSRGRATYLNEIRDIVMKYRKPETPVGIVRKAGRPGMNWTITDLEKLPDEDVDMQSTVIIGNSNTYVADGKMITPRGYKALIWIISGTQDGRELGAELADRENLKNRMNVKVGVVTRV